MVIPKARLKRLRKLLNELIPLHFCRTMPWNRATVLRMLQQIKLKYTDPFRRRSLLYKPSLPAWACQKKEFRSGWQEWEEDLVRELTVTIWLRRLLFLKN